MEGGTQEGGSGHAREWFQVEPWLHPLGTLQSHPALRQRDFCTMGSAVGHPREQGGVAFLGKEGAFSGESCRCKPFTTVLTAAGGVDF